MHFKLRTELWGYSTEAFNNQQLIQEKFDGIISLSFGAIKSLKQKFGVLPFLSNCWRRWLRVMSTLSFLAYTAKGQVNFNFKLLES
jgi:hypothetical protein